MLDIIIQVILAILLLLIMAFLAYSIYDNEYIKSIKIYNTNKKETKILDGIYEFDQPTYTVDTMNRFDPRYLDINPSVNQTGGAEYSYNFWLYYNVKNPNSYFIDGTSKDKYIVLFYKGLRNLINYNQFEYSCDTKSKVGNPLKYLLVKNPLVKLSNDGSHLVVEYNNINTPDTFNSSSSKKNCKITNLYDNIENKLGVKEMDNRLFNKTFNMITIVMQEIPTNEDELFVNRTNCKVFLNATLISNRSTLNNDLASETSTDSYSTVMKKNVGNLYINPYKHFEGISEHYVKAPINKITETDDITQDVPLKMADLSYFNYALTADDVTNLYLRKFNTEYVKPISIVNPKSINVGNKFNKDLYDSDNGNVMPVRSI